MDELKQKRAALIDEADAIRTAAQADDRDMTQEEADKAEEILAEADGVKGLIEAKQRIANVGNRIIADVSSLAAVDDARTAATTATGSEPSGHVTNVTPTIENLPNRGFESFGEQIHFIAQACIGNQAPDSRLEFHAAAAGSSQVVGSEGGYLVAPTFSNQIYDRFSVDPMNMLDRTDSYTVTGESLTFPADAETDVSAFNVGGGVLAYWISEAASITVSNPTFKQVKIEPQELAVLIPVTNKLLNNTTALEQWITRKSAIGINLRVGDSIFNGTGSGQPKGIIGHGGVINVAKETGQAATTVVYENITKMWNRLHANARANAAWYINQDVEPQLDNMSLAVGTGGAPVYLPQGGIADAPFGRLKGRPVIPVPYCQTLGTKGDIVLGDLKSYATGTTGGVETAMSIHLYFQTAQSAFRTMFAVDGQPWTDTAFTPLHGTTTTSPLVTLATRS